MPPTLPKPAPAASSKKRASLAAAAVLLLGGFGVYWFFLRPTPLEQAQKALDLGTPEVAVELLLEHLRRPGLLPAEEQPLRRTLAQAYLMKGAFDGAEEAFRTLDQRFPNDPAAALGLGFLFFSRGQDAFAVEHLTKAKTLSPEDPRASMALATLFNFRGDFDKARAEALDLLNRAPDDTTARRLLGEAELGRGLFADAAAAFQAVQQASPGDPSSRRLLARSFLGAGELRQAEETLSALLEANPNDPSALLLQAELLGAQSHPEQSEALLRRIFEDNPARLFAGISLARAVARRGDTAAAQDLLLDIGQRLPKTEDMAPPPYASFYEPWDNLTRRRDVRDIRTHFHLASGDTYKSRYLLPDAERQARLALQLSPHDVDVLRAWTDLKRVSGDNQEWLKASEEAAQIFPQHPHVMLDRAQALLAAKRAADALTLAQAAAGAAPSLARAHALLAQVQLALGLKDDAQAAADKALGANDRDPEAFLAAGLVKAGRADWRAAEKALARAVELNDLAAAAHWELAKALDKQKKTRDALAHRERALELEPRVYARR